MLSISVHLEHHLLLGCGLNEDGFTGVSGMTVSILGNKGPAKFFTALVANIPMSTRVQIALATSGSTASVVSFDPLSLKWPQKIPTIRT